MTCLVTVCGEPFSAMTPPETDQLLPALSTIRVAEGIMVPLAEGCTVAPEPLEPPELLVAPEPPELLELLELPESDASVPPMATMALVGEPKLALSLTDVRLTAKLLPLPESLIDTEMVLGV